MRLSKTSPPLTFLLMKNKIDIMGGPKNAPVHIILKLKSYKVVVM